MKTLLTLLFLAPLVAFGQVTVDVEAGGSLAPGSTVEPYFDPMDIAIQVGDAVHWVGVSGTHNVYGELDDFPDNPVGFSSGAPVADLDYFHTFTVPGIYGYHCTQQDHALTQHGTIQVIQPQGLEEIEGMGAFILFPQPADEVLTIELKGRGSMRADVLGVDGRLLRSLSVANVQRAVVDLGGLAAGRYLVRLVDNKGRQLSRPFIKGT